MNHTAQGYEATGLNPNYQPHTATEFLDKASETLGERGKQYDPAGKQERSMTAIVAAFNAIYPSNPLTVHMGWQFMTLVKMVRGATKPHADSALDQVAYAALAAECVAEALHQPSSSQSAAGCPHYGTPHVCITPEVSYTSLQVSNQALAEELGKCQHWAGVQSQELKHLTDKLTAQQELLTVAQHNANFYFDQTNSCIADNESMTAKFQAERKANVAMHEEVTRLRGKVQELSDLAEYRDKRNAELCAELETQRGKCIAQSARLGELSKLVENLRADLARVTKDANSACAELSSAQDEIRSLLAEKRHLTYRVLELEHGEGYEHQRKRIAQLESEATEATEARKRGSAGYNKQVAIQKELQKELDTVRGQLLGLFDILWKFPHHLTIEQLWHKVRYHADKSSVAWGESSYMSTLMNDAPLEAPVAHNTDEPKAPRTQYVDPFDSHGGQQPAPMHRLVGSADPARGGLAYPQGKDAPTPQ